MRVHILSDLHNEFGIFRPPPTAAEVVILAGDTDIGTKGVEWAKEAFANTRAVFYVPGNHEYYGQEIPALTDKLHEAAVGSNVHVLDCDKYELDDMVFLGATLWTDFKLLASQQFAMAIAKDVINDFRRIKVAPEGRTLRPEATVDWHIEARVWLEKELTAARSASKKVVVITHHLPSIRSILDRYRTDPVSAAFASHLDEMVAESGADLWIHGHTHTACDYMLGDTRVICNPRGYFPHETTAGTGFRPDLFFDVE